MCDKCFDFDKAIERYRRVITFIADQITVKEASELLAAALHQKALLHPEQEKGASSKRQI